MGVLPYRFGMTPTRVLILPRDGQTAEESFMPGMERLHGSQSWWNDSRGVLLYWYGTSPRESFSAGITTSGESFCHGI